MVSIIQHARDIKELERKVQEYFSTHIHKGCGERFLLDRIEFPKQGSNSTAILVYPKSGFGELCEDDRQWQEGLAKIGREYGVSLSIPCELYME